jgi:cytochrome c553
LQLRLLQERRRGGSDNVDLMHAFVNRLTKAEIDDVTIYYATLPS